MGKCKEKAAAAKALRLSRIRGAMLAGRAGRAEAELMLLTARSILIAETANMNCSSTGSPSECLYKLLNERDRLSDAPCLSGAAVCGIAPAGLYYSGPREPYQDEDYSGYEQMLAEAADMAAIAGGSIAESIQAAVLVHILHEIMSDKVDSAVALGTAACDATARCKEIFTDGTEAEHIRSLEEMLNSAARLSANSSTDSENLSCILNCAGKAAELSSALYCCMRYYGDLKKTLAPFTAGVQGECCDAELIRAADVEADIRAALGMAWVIMGSVTGYHPDGDSDAHNGADDGDMTAAALNKLLLEAADDIAEGPKAEGLRVTAYWADKYLMGE